MPFIEQFKNQYHMNNILSSQFSETNKICVISPILLKKK